MCLLWTWRRNAREALACETAQRFIPVRLAAEPLDAPAAKRARDPVPSGELEATGTALPSGSIEIAVGRTRVRVQGAVDQNALRQVLALAATAR